MTSGESPAEAGTHQFVMQPTSMAVHSFSSNEVSNLGTGVKTTDGLVALRPCTGRHVRRGPGETGTQGGCDCTGNGALNERIRIQQHSDTWILQEFNKTSEKEKDLKIENPDTIKSYPVSEFKITDSTP